MARINRKGALQGTSGPVYFRVLNGQQIVQTRPNRKNQKKGRNLNAKMMKNISTDLMIIRHHVVDFIGNRQDSMVHFRLSGAAMKVLNLNTQLPANERSLFTCPLQGLQGFQWNNKYSFNDAFLGRFRVNESDHNALEVIVESFVPQEQVVFPPTCTHASLRFALFGLNKTSEIEVKKENFLDVSFSKIQPLVDEKRLVFSTPKTKSALFLVVEIQFFYAINNDPNQLTLYNSKAYNPSAIVYAK